MFWVRYCFFLLAIVCSNANPRPSVIRMSQDLEDKGKGHGSIHTKETKPKQLEFSLARIFQDNMVLQRAPKRARVFGFSPNIGAKVMGQMITPKNMYYYSTSVVQGPAEGVGYWVVTLDAMNITDPVTIKFVSQSGALTLHNVLFGDVWLCSGQSNMQFSVSQMLNGAQEAQDAHNYPNMRLFTVSKVQSSTPLYDLAAVDENWTAPSVAKVSNAPWTYFSSVCWLYGKYLYQSLGYPVGMVATDWGGTPVEAWSSPEALAKCPVNQTQKHTADRIVDNFRGPQTDSSLWNAMINPLLSMTIYGAVWYQGENDAMQPSTMNNYNCTFPTMIDDWRARFHKESENQTSDSFPFGFVQLSANRPDPNITVGFPDIRWHQTADRGFVPNTRMPNTFMAVAMDLPDFESSWGAIHPRDKEDVGYRLSLSGLAVAYNKTRHYQGPFPSHGHFYPPHTLTLSYGPIWTLNIKNANGFEINCQSRTSGVVSWYPIPITSHNHTTVSFNTSMCGQTPQALRYAWRESPCPFKACAVYSTINDLPGPPFTAPFEPSKNTKNGIVKLKL